MIGSRQYWANNFVDIATKLFPHNQSVANLLRNVQVVHEEYSKVLLSGMGMSPSWRHQRKMLIFYTIVDAK